MLNGSLAGRIFLQQIEHPTCALASTSRAVSLVRRGIVAGKASELRLCLTGQRVCSDMIWIRCGSPPAAARRTPRAAGRRTDDWPYAYRRAASLGDAELDWSVDAQEARSVVRPIHEFGIVARHHAEMVANPARSWCRAGSSICRVERPPLPLCSSSVDTRS